MDWCVFRPWNYINGPAYDGADIADEGLPPSHLLKPSYDLKPAWKDSVEERSAPEPAPVAPTTKKYWEVRSCLGYKIHDQESQDLVICWLVVTKVYGADDKTA
ncbi:hypothetical protein QWA68_011309 [Fusarium oxysporum]|nr:hypothetical protein QWA68_011309 [Fusarium oxysporum]